MDFWENVTKNLFSVHVHECACLGLSAYYTGVGVCRPLEKSTAYLVF